MTYKEFKEAYRKTEEENAQMFTFNGRRYNNGFVELIIEYLEMAHFPDDCEVDFPPRKAL